MSNLLVIGATMTVVLLAFPTKGPVSQVVVKTGKQEYPIWPEKKNPFLEEAAESGIYVRLERGDVYSVDWHFENQSGGMANADGTALESGVTPILDLRNLNAFWKTWEIKRF